MRGTELRRAVRRTGELFCFAELFAFGTHLPIVFYIVLHAVNGKRGELFVRLKERIIPRHAIFIRFRLYINDLNAQIIYNNTIIANDEKYELRLHCTRSDIRLTLYYYIRENNNNNNKFRRIVFIFTSSHK